MTLPFKPMLSADASTVDLSTLHYPLLVSPKLDGVRALIWEGVAYSRNAKPIRNHFVQRWAKDLNRLDGELVVGSPTSPHCLNTTQSGVMSFEGNPDFTFHAFDILDDDRPFKYRWSDLRHAPQDRIVQVEHKLVTCMAELLRCEEVWLTEGYEGIMLRDPQGRYKQGRSTLREGGLMKLKRFQDGEAVVRSVEEGSSNTNTLQSDELGRAKRSYAKSGLVPNGMVGTVIAVDPQWGELRIAPGTMSHSERRRHWVLEGKELIGKTIHWRSFGYGVKDKPRFPRFYGVREDK
jgi:DNA ligase-1